ncbi:hypothetical protein ACFO9Q_04750 [Paenibacillus sp. GCM10023252]|uniref:LiaF transmembrane domain-containing protein n=1 Tax=Paenibacillus sp. GCM10023252 TaxID=3252649 RepID=UPI00361A0D73
MDGKKALGVIAVVIGGLIVLNFLGIHLGSIIGFLFPFILIGLGFIGWKNNSKLIGGVLMAVGGLIVLGKLSGLIMFAAAVGLIVWGVSLFKRSKRQTF